MSTYYMLLVEEEDQSSDSIYTIEDELASVPFINVWRTFKKFLNTSKEFIKRNILKIPPLLRWGASILIQTFIADWLVTSPILIYFGTKFESVGDLIVKYPTAVKLTMFLALSLIVVLIFYINRKYTHMRIKSTQDSLNTESYLLNNRSLNILIEEDESKPTDESKLTDKESESWCRSIFNKLKNFFTKNYEKVRDLVKSKVNWSSRSNKAKIITGVAIAAIIGLLFSIVYFKLKGRPIKDIFTMLANFVSNHMYDIGFVVGILLVAVGIYYWKFKKPGDAVDKAIAAA